MTRASRNLKADLTEVWGFRADMAMRRKDAVKRGNDSVDFLSAHQRRVIGVSIAGPVGAVSERWSLVKPTVASRNLDILAPVQRVSRVAA